MSGGAAGHQSTRAQGDLAAIVRSSGDAIIGKTLDGTITSWNRGAERLYGYTAEEAVGQSIAMLVPDDAADELPSIFERLRAGREVTSYETRRRHKDGHIVDVWLTVSPILDAKGTVIGASAIARDVSETRRATRRMERLLNVTAGLAGALRVDDVVRISVELGVRATDADAAVLVLVEPDGETLRLVGTTGYDGDFIAQWSTWPLSDETPVNEAVREGRLVAVESLDELKSRYADVAPKLLATTVAAVAVPLATEGRPFGALGLRFTQPRRFTAEDRDELRSLGGQCAIALERARLFEAEQAARDRLTFLSEAGEALAASLDVDTLLSTTTRLAVPRLADWCGVSIVQEDRTVRRLAFRHVDDALVAAGTEWWERTPFPTSRHQGAPNVIRTGQPEITSRIDADQLERFTGDAEGALLRSLGLTASMVLPLVARGRTLGAVTFAMGRSGRHYSATDVQLAADLTRRAALAVDNARLFAERAHVARRLQESLLPQLLPDIPGVELAARYLAAGEGTEVGGDFYDVFSLGAGGWALVIGDVCGKGADAAGVTALARYTLRALAPRAADPADVLVEVNDALVRQKVNDERFLTAAYGVLSPHPDGGASLSVSLAGHPKPVVVGAGGAVERVGSPGTLLGVFSDVSLVNTTVELRPGDCLVLFTDGVIEAHGADGLFGDDRLDDTLRALAGLPADNVAAGVARAVTDHRTGGSPDAGDDDMAVLVVRIAG